MQPRMDDNEFVCRTIGVSLALCVTASIVPWLIVFGIGQSLEFFWRFVFSPLALILVLSAAAGLAIGTAFRREADRWSEVLIWLTILHGVYFGISWFYAVALSHV